MIPKVKKSLVIFYNKNGEILIHDKKKVSGATNAFGFFGGTLEDNEDPEEGLKRIVKKKLDYKIGDFQLFKVMTKKDLEMDLEWFLYLAPIPPIKKLKVYAGAIKILPIDAALNIDFSERDSRSLHEVLDFLNKKKIYLSST